MESGGEEFEGTVNAVPFGRCEPLAPGEEGLGPWVPDFSVN